MKRFSKLLTPLLAGAIVLSGQAIAQTPRDYYELEDRLEDLEKQIRTLQRTAAQGNLPEIAISGEMNENQAALLADMEVRLTQLQNEISLLTGQNEEILHRQQRIEEQLERFQRDVEFRFQEVGTSSQTVPGESNPNRTGNSLASTNVVLNPSPVDINVLPSGSAQEQYDYSFSLLRKGDYGGAETAFAAFMQKYPDNQLSGNAQYWLGETHYVRKNYPQAAAAFLKGFQDYQEGNKGPDNLLKLGMTLAAMGQVSEACTAFAELEAVYPNAPQTIVDRTAVQKDRNRC